MQAVAGLFNHFSDAEKAAQDLIDAGLPIGDISLIGPLEHEQEAKDLGITAESTGEARAGKDVRLGATVGGLSGLVIGLGLVSIPGLGPVRAAGPVATTLAGPGVGAAAGGLVTILTQAGLPEDEARVYAAGLRNGGTLVMVDSQEDKAGRVEKLLSEHHAIDLEAHAGLKSKDEAEAQQHEEKQRRGERRTEEREPGKKRFEKMEPDFQQHFDQHYLESGMSYGAYRSAYKFGFDHAETDLFRDEDWDQAEAELRKDWEHHHHTLDWSEYRDAIREGWYKAKQ